jgi:hypothetical protein
VVLLGLRSSRVLLYWGQFTTNYMKYPLHTVSKPVSGSEAIKLTQAIQSGGHLANEVALALMKKIADRRRRKSENAAK